MIEKKKTKKEKPKNTRRGHPRNVRYNDEENEILIEKAGAAKITVTEWIRIASLEQLPPKRKNVPEINQQAWFALGSLVSSLNDNIFQFAPAETSVLHQDILVLIQEITLLRNQLLNG